jgi:NAD(P)-dependent dehydrogenase (short-subunit alcohol dehydrogenase family)
MDSVVGKVALITGGGDGLGAEVARQLHARGAKLVLIDVNEGALARIGADLGEDRVVTAVADVRDLAAVQAAVDEGVERFGGIDIVMANAAIGAFGSTLRVDPEAFRAVVDINLLGVFHTVRAALPSVLDRHGYILVVSSISGFTLDAGMASYAATKAAVDHFASCLGLRSRTTESTLAAPSWARSTHP